MPIWKDLLLESDLLLSANFMTIGNKEDLVAFRFGTICYGTIPMQEGGDVYEEKNIRFDENRVFEKFVSGRFRTLGR